MGNVGFIHGSAGVGTVTLVHTTAGSVDAEGRVAKNVVNEDVPSCRFAILTATERQRESRPGQDINASLLVPLGTSVDDSDVIAVAIGDTYLDGNWRVMTVRHAVVHLRVLVGQRGA